MTAESFITDNIYPRRNITGKNRVMKKQPCQNAGEKSLGVKDEQTAIPNDPEHMTEMVILMQNRFFRW